MAKLTITTVADPMMGLLWETWPTIRKLETHFREQVEFKFMMGQLVRDVYELVDSETVKKYGKTVALNQYWTRLMQVYLHEEQIAGMPIYMGGNERLFDATHTSSVPLSRGLRAIAGQNQEVTGQVLYELQYDTVVNDLQTNDLKYLTALAARFNVDRSQFVARYNSADVANQLAQEQQVMQQMQVSQLPAYILAYNGKTYVVKGIPQYSEWLKLFNQIAGGALQEKAAKFNIDEVNRLIDSHPHISSLELKEAFDVDDEQTIIDLLKDSSLEKQNVKGTFFTRRYKEKA
ncbi:DsbA family protein [uncultured Limosilactobacillus sp.]|uniref:DsbA family protein n=1 Tax=uncultured Limosilactobacillus sp. TaxID=2837629 RepID=UPI0025FB7884|nr:DsbA family protein [uncultured Limosilactobacillus sp.]